MVHALDVTFDRRSEARMRRAWEELRDAGLPSLARHTAPSNRPHLTLDSRDSVAADVEARLPEVATRLPLEVRVGSVVLFRARQRWVVARHVVVDRPLLELHEHAHEVLGPGGAPVSQPGQWVPHLTLARGVSDEELPAVLRIAGSAPPFTATALRLRRWDDEAGEAWEVPSRPQRSSGRSL